MLNGQTENNGDTNKLDKTLGAKKTVNIVTLHII